MRSVRPLARYPAPMPLTNAAGAIDEAPPPRADVEPPITFTRGRNACSTSQQRASSASYLAGDTGRQKNLPFGSFQITMSLTVGKRSTMLRANPQNRSREAGVVGASAPQPETER